VAASFLDVALAALRALGRTNDPVRFEVESRLGRMRLALGELDSATSHYDDAAALAPDVAARAEARRGAAVALTISGRLADAGSRLEAALDEIGGPAVDHRAIIPLYQSMALLDWCKGQFAAAQERALACLDAAARHGDRDGEIRACELLVLCSHGLGDWQAGVEWERRRAALSGPRLDVGELFDVHLCLWDMFLHDPAGRPRVREMLSATEAEAQRLGSPRILALCRCVAGSLAQLEDRLDEAERSLREAAELFRQSGVASGEAASLVRLGCLLTARGRTDEAGTLLHDGLFVAERATMRAHVLVRLHAAIAENHRANGKLDAAREAVREGEASEERWGRCMSCHRFLVSASQDIVSTS
jgi:tetratricopeptide (TPR) repeat protein